MGPAIFSGPRLLVPRAQTRVTPTRAEAPTGHSLGRLKLEGGNESAELMSVRCKNACKVQKGAVSRNDATQAHGGIANGRHDSSG